MHVGLVLDLRPLFTNSRRHWDSAYFDWQDFIFIWSVLGYVCRRRYRPPFVLILTFDVLVFSSILVLNDFRLFSVQLVNVLENEVRPF